MPSLQRHRPRTVWWATIAVEIRCGRDEAAKSARKGGQRRGSVGGVRARPVLSITMLAFAWACIRPGAATMAAIAYLLWLLRTSRLTPGRLATAAGFYTAFAVALGLTL